VDGSGTVVKAANTPEAVVTLAPAGNERLSIGGSPKLATPPTRPSAVVA
jgi:hypothetical protein